MQRRRVQSVASSLALLGCSDNWLCEIEHSGMMSSLLAFSRFSRSRRSGFLITHIAAKSKIPLSDPLIICICIV